MEANTHAREVALRVVDLGLIEYREAHKLQLRLVEERLRGGDDTLLLLEHPHVITLGKRAKNMEIPARDIPVIRVERGGEATYHGPGQLIGYTIVDLRERRLGVWEYVRMLEEVLIKVLREYGVNAGRREKAPGVWIGDKKIASIGLALKHWVTYHGFALNVSTDLSYFRLIRPCGFDPDVMTSLERVLGRRVDMREIKSIVAYKFAEVFGYSTIKLTGLAPRTS